MQQSATVESAVQSEPEPKGRPFIVSLFLGLVLSFLAAIVGGLIWAAVCYFTDTNYFFLTVVIGLVVAMAATIQFKKVNIGIALILVVPCVAFTLLSVAFGDFIYYVLNFAREFEISYMDAAEQVIPLFMDIETSVDGGAGSLVMGGLGALFGFYRAVRS